MTIPLKLSRGIEKGERLRSAVVGALTSEWMSRQDIAAKITANTPELVQTLAWLRRTQSGVIEVWERIDKPTLYRRKV